MIVRIKKWTPLIIGAALAFFIGYGMPAVLATTPAVIVAYPDTARQLAVTSVSGGEQAQQGVADAAREDSLKKIPELRQAYVNEVNGLTAVAEQMKGEGKSSEEIARHLHGLRRELGIKYKMLTPPDLLEKIYQRNIEKYGDKLGPTIDYLRKQGKSWDDIIKSATRTGGKDLGF